LIRDFRYLPQIYSFSGEMQRHLYIRMLVSSRGLLGREHGFSNQDIQDDERVAALNFHPEIPPPLN
jgi:hypothetical protein